MKWLLIMYIVTYGTTFPVLHEFDSQTQCEIVAKKIISEQGGINGFDCLPLDGKEHGE
jgi:hypothetical protein